MPIYEYRCEACGHQEEFLQRVSEPPLTECPVCRKPTFHKLLSAAGFQLKGSGWYVTDYAGKTTKNEKSESESTTDSKSDKTDTKTKESSPKKTSDKASPSKPSTGD